MAEKNKNEKAAQPVWTAMQTLKCKNFKDGNTMLGTNERAVGTKVTLNGKFAVKTFDDNGYVVFNTEDGGEIPARQFIGGFTGTKSVELDSKTYQGTLETTPEKYLAFCGMQNVIYDEMLTALRGKTVEYLGSQVRICNSRDGKPFVIKKHFWKQVD